MKIRRNAEVKTNKFEVGDIIEFVLNDGEEVEAVAVKQEKDGMLFCLVDCLRDEMPMNLKPTNKGGYEKSYLRTKLNTDIINRFPEEIRTRMKPFKNGDMLRIPTEKEIFGKNEYGETEKDIEQIELMKQRRNRVAFQGRNGDWEWYWLQNSAVASATRFACCNNVGVAYYLSASGELGVRPLFLIG